MDGSTFTICSGSTAFGRSRTRPRPTAADRYPVVQREWAGKNPRATFKTPITVDDVLNSRMIAYPFRLLQCGLVTDGGGALILVAAERAKDFPQKPVYLLGTGQSVETPMVSQMEGFTSSHAFRVAGAKAFAEAGIMHNDVDHMMIYDALCSLP